MWYLIEDLFEQSAIVNLFVGLGWLAVIIMVCSFAQGWHELFASFRG